MSLFEIIGTMWAAGVFAIVMLSWRFRARQPKQPASGPRRCTCGICTRKVQTVGLMLTTEQLADVQTAVLAVGIGAAPALVLDFDHVGEQGVGRVCVVVVNAPICEQVLGPAIEAHMRAAGSDA